MNGLRALLWDVDGTLAETERDAHRVAFNQAFEACALPWHWDVDLYGRLLRVAGGKERLLHFMDQVPDAPTGAAERLALAQRLHGIKNRAYGELVTAGRIPLRDGVLPLMQEARERSVRMGIATTTSRSNVAALLVTHLGDDWASWFDAVVCGEDVARKKPDPEVYTLVLRQMRLEPGTALAIEDSIDGTAAARAAGLPVIVTRSVYFAHAEFAGATAIGPGLHTRLGWQPEPRARAGAEARITLDDVDRWLESAWPLTARNWPPPP